MAIVLGKDFDNNPGGQMGEALGRGLQQLAQYKMQQMHERHIENKQSNALMSAIPGLTSEQAKAVVLSDDRTRPYLLQYLAQQAGKKKQAPGIQMQGQQLEEQEMSPNQYYQPQQTPNEALGEPQQPMWQQNALQRAMGSLGGMQQQQQPMQQMGQQQGDQGLENILEPDTQQPAKTQDQGFLDFFSENWGVTPQMRQAKEIAYDQMAQKERLATEAREHETNKYRERHVDKILDEGREELKTIGEQQTNRDAQLRELESIENMNATGKLIQGPEQGLLQKYNLEDIWTNTESQVAKKSMQRLLLDQAKGFKGTGTRVTNQIFESMQAALPSLLNGQEANAVILARAKADVKIANAQEEETAKLLTEYIDKNKLYPANYKQIAAQRAEKKIVQYAKEAKAEVDSIINRTQSNELPDPTRYQPNSVIELNGKTYRVNATSTGWIKE